MKRGPIWFFNPPIFPYIEDFFGFPWWIFYLSIFYSIVVLNSTHPSFHPLRPLGEVVNRLIEEHLTWGAQVINSLGDKKLLWRRWRSKSTTVHAPWSDCEHVLNEFTCIGLWARSRLSASSFFVSFWNCSLYLGNQCYENLGNQCCENLGNQCYENLCRQCLPGLFVPVGLQFHILG